MAHVLIIEDDDQMRTVVQEWLGEEDHLVDGVRTAEEGLREVRGCRPDLVILDLNLPGMHGRQFVESARSEPGLHDLPIMLVSGSTDVARAVQELGVNEGLQKPLPLDHLSALVERLTAVEA